MKPLWTRCVSHAFRSLTILGTGSATLLLSAVLWNPLPTILWALGVSGFLAFAATSPRYARRVLTREGAARAICSEARRDHLAARLATALEREPARHLAERHALPDYLSRFQALAARRHELPPESECMALGPSSLGRQTLDSLLDAYLRLALARLAILRVDGGASQVEREITELEAAIAREPTTETIRRRHLEVLRARLVHIAEEELRGQRLAAQLEAIPALFELTLERVGAPAMESDSEYAAGVLAQSEEAERWVQALHVEREGQPP
ncbi:MAG: hypothetical protein HY901_23940 [Deltaproteobacteria bacterium]|nr:hypothetical protein [Deltaproteobacteria bacterium]